MNNIASVIFIEIVFSTNQGTKIAHDQVSGVWYEIVAERFSATFLKYADGSESKKIFTTADIS